MSYCFGIVWKHFSTVDNDPWTSTPDMLYQRHDFHFLGRVQIVSRATDNNIRTHGGVLVCSVTVSVVFPDAAMVPQPPIGPALPTGGLMASALSSVLALKELLTTGRI